MSIPPQKRHGAFCRLRSKFVRRSARSVSSNPWTASSSIDSSSTNEAHNARPDVARCSLPTPTPPFVHDGDRESLPQIPDLPSPIAAQNTLPGASHNEPAQPDSLSLPVQQAGSSSSAVTFLPLNEGPSERAMSGHGSEGHGNYDPNVSTPPPASAPYDEPAANTTNPFVLPRTLAQEDQVQSRPAQAGPYPEGTQASTRSPLWTSGQGRNSVPISQPSRDSASSFGETEPADRTRAFFAFVENPNERLPGLKLEIVVGSLTPDHDLFDDAMVQASEACRFYGHQVTQLSVTINDETTLDDGRDALGEILGYLRGQLGHLLALDLDMPEDQLVERRLTTGEGKKFKKPAERHTTISADTNDSWSDVVSGLSNLRYLRVAGNTSGERVLALPRTRMRELHLMRHCCALDVPKLVAHFPGLDLLQICTIGRNRPLFRISKGEKKRLLHSDFPLHMYVKTDLETLDRLVGHIPDRVRLCVMLTGSLHHRFDDNPQWFLQYSHA